VFSLKKMQQPLLMKELKINRRQGKIQVMTTRSTLWFEQFNK